jgi:hypothetical protein
MRQTGLVAAMIIVAGLTAGQALGAQLFFTVGPVPDATTYSVVVDNPVVNLDPSGVLYPSSVEVHLWATGVVGVEKVVGLGIDILSATPGVAAGGAPTVYDTPGILGRQKWEDGYSPGTPDDLVQGTILPAVTTDALDWTDVVVTVLGYDPDYNMPAAAFHVLSFEVTPVSAGTTEVFLTSNIKGGIVYGGTPEAPTSGDGTFLGNYGAFDDAVPTNTPGTASALADLTINVVVPEPASLALLALGGLALIRRR